MTEPTDAELAELSDRDLAVDVYNQARLLDELGYLHAGTRLRRAARRLEAHWENRLAAQRLEARGEITEATIQRSVRAACDVHDPGECRFPGCGCKMLPGVVRTALEAAQKGEA